MVAVGAGGRGFRLADGCGDGRLCVLLVVGVCCVIFSLVSIRISKYI